MFGIGFGEIILILLVVFLIAPKEIPAVLKKIGSFFRELDKLKREIFSMKGEMEEIINEARKTVKDAGENLSPGNLSVKDDLQPIDFDHPPIKVGDVEMIYRKKGKKADGKKPLQQKPEKKET